MYKPTNMQPNVLYIVQPTQPMYKALVQAYVKLNLQSNVHLYNPTNVNAQCIHCTMYIVQAYVQLNVHLQP